jgi:surface protein
MAALLRSTIAFAQKAIRRIPRIGMLMYLAFHLLSSGSTRADDIAPPAEWIRPADWRPLPNLRPGEQKMVGLSAVFPFDDNFCVLAAEGDYVVDWGDGSAPETYKSGATAKHNFNHASCGGAPCSRGYKTVFVTVTPQPGAKLTRLDLNKPHLEEWRSNWLDLTISSKELTSLVIGWRNPCVSHRLLEQVTIKEQQLTDTSYLFNICNSLQSVPLFDTSRVTTMAAMLWGAMKLRTIPHFDTRNVTSMADMFRECYGLEVVPKLDTSKVKSMSCMFRYAISLRSVPSFDTSACTNMTMLFQYCWNLRRAPELDTSKVTNMRWMFQNCYLLKTIPAYDTSNVTDFRSMFSGAESLLIVPKLDVGKGEDFGTAFNGCAQLTQNLMHGAVRNLDLSNQNLSVAELNRIYANLGRVEGKTVDVTGNYGTAGHDPSLAASRGWTVVDRTATVSASATARRSEAATSELVKLGLTPIADIWARPNDWPTLPAIELGEAKTVGLYAVFPFADNFVAISAAEDYVVDWGDGSRPELFKSGVNAEHNCRYDTCGAAPCRRGYKTCLVTLSPQSGRSLTQIDLQRRHGAVPVNGKPLRTNWLDLAISAEHLATLTIGKPDPVVSHSLLEQVRIGAHRLTATDYLFHQCKALESVQAFDTSRVVNMAGMFSGARSLRKVPQLDTSRVVKMQNMFRDCGSLKTIPLLDTAQVTDMSGMFQTAFLLSALPKLDTSLVESMAGMFDAAWMLEELPLFDTAKVKSMRQMFRQCGMMFTIPAFDTSNVEDMRQMFMGSWGLLVVPDLNVARVTDFTETFGEAGGQCRQVTKLGFKGIASDINLGDKTLSGGELKRIIENLAVVKDKTLTLSGNYGLTEAHLSAVAAKGYRANTKPIVDAGSDMKVKFPATVTLTAIVVDDGLPQVAAGMTYVWFLDAYAPGTVTYGTQRSRSTTLSFSAPGRYVLRCAVGDGHLSGSDAVVVTVEP